MQMLLSLGKCANHLTPVSSHRFMMTSSNRNIFRVTAHLCGEIHRAQRPVTWSFDVSFDLHLNKRLSKQWRDWWFETLSRSLWRLRNFMAVEVHSYVLSNIEIIYDLLNPFQRTFVSKYDFFELCKISRKIICMPLFEKRELINCSGGHAKYEMYITFCPRL